MRTRIGAMAVAVAAAALSTAARGQECVWAQNFPNPPWQVSDMRIEASWMSIYGSFSSGLCPLDCSFETTARVGNVYLSGGPCPAYMGNGNMDPRYPAWVMWWSNRLEFREVWNSWVSSIGTISITFTLPHAVRIESWQWELQHGWTVVGGHVLSEGGYPIRYIRAGTEITVSRAWSFDGLWSEYYPFEWNGCDDYNSNGICDEYETLARDFGDFDASGNVGAPDLATMLSAWGSSGGTNGVIDLDDDGVVGASDLGILLSRWGFGA